MYDETDRFLPPPEAYDRPKVRADCLAGGVNEARPCPWVSCRHHLAIDLQKGPRSSGVSLIEHGDPAEMAETCALDVADQGEHHLVDIGRMIGVSRERVRQIEEDAKSSMTSDRRHLPILRDVVAQIDENVRRDGERNAQAQVGPDNMVGRVLEDEDPVDEFELDEDASWRDRMWRAYEQRLERRGLVKPKSRRETVRARAYEKRQLGFTWTQEDEAELRAWLATVVLVDGDVRIGPVVDPGDVIEEVEMDESTLTERERGVLAGYRAGIPVPDIASSLGMAIKTAYDIARRVSRKGFSLTKRTEAA